MVLKKYNIPPDEMKKINMRIRENIKPFATKMERNKPEKVLTLPHSGLDDKNLIRRLKAKLLQLIDRGSRSRLVREVTKTIIRGYGVKPKDYINELAAVSHWVQFNIRYTLDKGEMFQSAPRQLYDWFKKRDGSDCDCVAILVSAMMKSVGHGAGIALVDSKGGGQINHAMALVRLPKAEKTYKGKWILVELTERFVPEKFNKSGEKKRILPGWRSPAITLVSVAKLKKG